MLRRVGRCIEAGRCNLASIRGLNEIACDSMRCCADDGFLRVRAHGLVGWMSSNRRRRSVRRSDSCELVWKPDIIGIALRRVRFDLLATPIVCKGTSGTSKTERSELQRTACITAHLMNGLHQLKPVTKGCKCLHMNIEDRVPVRITNLPPQRPSVR